ncbi:MAG: NADH-quinone oxidoreductase subunit N [Anaerolineales bacterium]
MTFELFTPSNLLAVLPEFLLVVLAALVMGLDVAWPESRKRALGLVTAAGLGAIIVVALVFSRPSSGAEGALIFGGMLRDDFAAFFFRVMFIFSGMIVALLSVDAPGVERRGDYYAIVIASVLGMNFMASSADLIMLYLAIETTSISGYLLAGYLRDDPKSTEAGLKYFLFGAFTSTVMLYGFSLLYGFTGETNLYRVGQAISSGVVPVPAMVTAILLVLVGFGFKVAAVPFHFWTPDVYEGAPTPITAFISVASKAAGFAVLVRVMLAVFPDLQSYWQPLIAVVAAFTMSLGNLIALTQRNIKRLLAYSSIAQAGYALVGLAAVSEAGVASIIFYLAMYTLTNLAAFGVVILTSRVIGSDEIKDYAGLSRRAPALALVFLIAFLSLGGMPPLAGFFGKFFVFAAAIQQGMIWLAVLGVLNAIVGLYYYLIVLKVVYLYRSENENVHIPVPRAYALALWVCVLGILLLGTWAGPWIGWATAAAGNLF